MKKLNKSQRAYVGDMALEGVLLFQIGWDRSEAIFATEDLRTHREGFVRVGRGGIGHELTDQQTTLYTRHRENMKRMAEMYLPLKVVEDSNV